MTYVSSFYHAFSGAQKVPAAAAAVLPERFHPQQPALGHFSFRRPLPLAPWEPDLGSLAWV